MKKEQVGKDLLTGQPIYQEAPENDICPACGKRSWTGDAYHQLGKYQNPQCGHTMPYDD